jgi:hypothetical protein
MAKRRKLDLDELTGDPTMDQQIMEGEREATWHRQADLRAADKMIRAKLDQHDEELGKMGVKDWGPAGPNVEYMDGPLRKHEE